MTSWEKEKKKCGVLCVENVESWLDALLQSSKVPMQIYIFLVEVPLTSHLL